MKKYLLIFAAFTFIGTANMFGQNMTVNGEIPSVVMNNFKSEYPKTSDVKWKTEGSLYRVSFEMADDIDQKIWYNSNSEIVKHEIEIAKSELPANIVNKIKAEFAGYDIDEVEKITINNKVQYEVELEAFMKKDWEVTFDENGTILQQRAD